MRAPVTKTFWARWLVLGTVALAGTPGVLGQIVFRVEDVSGDNLSDAFLAAWHLEVMQGQFENAAELYEEVYSRAPLARRRRSASASGTSRDSEARDSREVGLMAAYRAGVCFEALGLPRKATLAYRALKRHGREGEPLYELALAYLKGQGQQRSRSDIVGSEEILSIQEILEKIRSTTERRRRTAERLEQELFARRQRAAWRRSLQERLRHLGLRAVWPMKGAPRGELAQGGGEVWIEEIRAAVGTGDFGEATEGVLASLESRYYQRALHSVLSLDLDRALRETTLALGLAELQGERRAGGGYGPPTKEWIQRDSVRELQQLLMHTRSQDLLVRLARRRLNQHRSWTVARVRQDLKQRLGRAQTAGRFEFRALDAIEDTRRFIEPMSAAILGDPEVRPLVERVERDYWRLVAGRDASEAERLARLWNDSSAASRRVLVLAEDYFDAVVDEWIHVAPRFTGEVETVATAEMRRLELELGALRTPAGPPPREAVESGQEPRERKERRIEFLLGTLRSWFPFLNRK